MGKWLTTEEVKNRIKTEMGLKGNQFSVRAEHSTQYIKVSICRGQEANVDRARLEAVCRGMDTWSMDMTDYVTGQSIRLANPKWRPGDSID